MNPYDGEPDDQPGYDQDSQHQDGYGPPPTGRASVGRASVPGEPGPPAAGRAPVGRAPVGGGSHDMPESAGNAPYGLDAYTEDAFGPSREPFGQRDPRAGSAIPEPRPVPPTGRATVGRASIRPSGPLSEEAFVGGDGFDDDYGVEPPGGEGPRWRRSARQPESRTARQRRRRRQNVLIATFAIFIMLCGLGVVVGTYYVDGIPTPDQLALPEATTVYYADGKTVMARLGEENRTILDVKDIEDPVKQAIVAAEDQTFWTNPGVDFTGVLRAAWNNFTGGQTQGASTLTQQYARMAMDLKGATYSRKLREAVIAWKLGDKYTKEEILGFYLNTVPFGRNTRGVEAAAQAYFHKSASMKAPAAQRLTVSEAMLLVSFVKQPEIDPTDPVNKPGYDPTRGPIAEQNAIGRWSYVRDNMVKLGYLTQAQANAVVFPPKGDVLKYDPNSSSSMMDQPTGLVVQHALSELRQSPEFAGKPKGYIENGGYKIVTTVNKLAEDAAIRAADLTNPKAPSTLRGQSSDWRAALVAVQPGTGRVLAYFGGKNGTGSDYAGWYIDEDGDPTGNGRHQPGSTFKVYDMIAALRDGYSLDSYWDSPPLSKNFPDQDRVPGKLGPVHNAEKTGCTPLCPLWQAAVNSLNIPFFDLTRTIGPRKVLAAARDAGIDSMWHPGENNQLVRVDLRTADLLNDRQYYPGDFSTELGIGQFPISVADHANGMATVAANGMRAQEHFVVSVSKDGKPVYSEKIQTKSIGLTVEQVGDLDAALRQVSTSRTDAITRGQFEFANTWDVASKTGTWEWKSGSDYNAQVWVTGYTKALATAVWLGTQSGSYLNPKNDSPSNVFGNNYAGPIWQQFMTQASATLFPHPDDSMLRFQAPGHTGNLNLAGESPSPTPTIAPTMPGDSPTSPSPGPGGPGQGGGGQGPGGLPTITITLTRRGH